MNTSQNNLVSICLVTYNQKQFIASAIESALMQKTNFEYEIVIGDDCSTDGTLEICVDYAKRYPNKIRVIKRENNLGLIINFVETIKQCAGQFIAYLEGDDYWITDNKLQVQINILINDKNVSLVHTNWKDYILKDNIIIDNARDFKGLCKSEILKGIEAVKTFLSNGYGGIRASSIMFRADDVNDIIEKDHDFFKDKEMKTFDYFIFCEFAYKGVFRFINEDTTLYRMNINSISINTDVQKMQEYSFGILKTIMYLLKKHNLRNSSKYQFNRILSSLLFYCLESKDFVLLNKIDKSIKLFKIYIYVRHKILLFGQTNHLHIVLKPIVYLNHFIKYNFLGD